MNCRLVVEEQKGNPTEPCHSFWRQIYRRLGMSQSISPAASAARNTGMVVTTLWGLDIVGGIAVDPDRRPCDPVPGG